MKLDQWAQEIAAQFGISRGEAREVMLFISARIRRGLAEGATVRIRGVGDFSVMKAAPRRGAINPKTREPVATRARARVRFRPSTMLRRVLNPDA